MYSIGEAVNLNCADTTGSANLVQWLNSTGMVLTFSSTSVTLTISLLTDEHHGIEYTCRIHSSGVLSDLNYTIIVLSKLLIGMKSGALVTLCVPFMIQFPLQTASLYN